MSNENKTPAQPSSTTEPGPRRRRRQAAEGLRVDVAGLADPQDLVGLDPESLDPEKHYRFFAETNRRMSTARTLGYRVVKRSEDGPRLLADEEGGAAEDVIRVGDMVLYECDRDSFEERRDRRQKLAQARLSTPEGQFRKRARRSNARVVGQDSND